MRKDHDYFSIGVIIYGVCFFLSYKTLFQLSYVDTFSALGYWGYGLVIVHIAGFIWCVVACLFRLMPRQLGSFISAAMLVLGLEFISPVPNGANISGCTKANILRAFQPRNQSPMVVFRLYSIVTAHICHRCRAAICALSKLFMIIETIFVSFLNRRTGGQVYGRSTITFTFDTHLRLNCLKQVVRRMGFAALTSRRTSAARAARAAAALRRPRTPADPRTASTAPSAIPRTARSRCSRRPRSRLRRGGCAG